MVERKKEEVEGKVNVKNLNVGFNVQFNDYVNFKVNFKANFNVHFNFKVKEGSIKDF